MESGKHEPSQIGQDSSGLIFSLSAPGVLPTLHSHPKQCAYCPITEGMSCQGQDARRLCMLIDPGHPEYTPEYVATIRSLARPRETYGTRPAERSNLAEALSLLGAMKACPFRTVDTVCGCAGARCGLRQGSIVSYPECLDCLRQYGGNHEA
jgi:hypothetical protein